MRYDHLATQLKRFPERYLWFGPYWWTMKLALKRAGYDFGSDDDAGVRAQLEKIHGSADATEKQAMQFYSRNTGAMRNHTFTLPNGTPYFLHDEDVTARAVI